MPTCLASTFRYVIAAAALFALGCGGSASDRDISEPPQRAGTEIAQIAARYLDHQPAINADGTVVVFLSKRAAKGKDPLSKAYKVDWPAGGDPGEPERLTSGSKPAADSQEVDVAISPAGAWTAVVAVADGQADLWLVKVADGTAVRVTDDDALESQPAFSPDSKLLSWLSFDAATGKKSVKIVDVSGAPSALPEAGELPADEVNGAGFWLTNATGPYSYAVQRAVDGDRSLTRIDKLTFADAEAAGDATTTEWIESLRLERERGAAKGGDDKALLVRRALRSEGRLSQQAGTSPKSTTRPVNNEPTFAAYDGSDVAQFDRPPGYEVLSADINKAGDAALLVERELYMCDKSKEQLLGVAIAVATTTPPEELAADPTAVQRFVPRTTKKAGVWEVGDSLCDTERDDESKGVLDDKISSAVIAANGTRTAFRAVYVTRFSKAYDAKCVLKTGDMEIMALEVDGDEREILPVSRNAAPLKSDDRGDDKPCG